MGYLIAWRWCTWRWAAAKSLGIEDRNARPGVPGRDYVRFLGVQSKMLVMG